MDQQINQAPMQNFPSFLSFQSPMGMGKREDALNPNPYFYIPVPVIMPYSNYPQMGGNFMYTMPENWSPQVQMQVQGYPYQTIPNFQEVSMRDFHNKGEMFYPPQQHQQLQQQQLLLQANDNNNNNNNNHNNIKQEDSETLNKKRKKQHSHQPLEDSEEQILKKQFYQNGVVLTMGGGSQTTEADNLLLYHRREDWIKSIQSEQLRHLLQGTNSVDIFQIREESQGTSSEFNERVNHSITQMTVQDLLRQDKAMFHNQSKLYFNYMLKQIIRQVQLTRLPALLMDELVRISQKIKYSGRRLDSRSVRKTDFYNHSHYNVCFMIITDTSIEKLKPRDIALHKQVYNIDLQGPFAQLDPEELEKVNFFKKCLFEIYRRYFQVSNCEIKKQYHSRAVRGIELMINGKFVQRF